MNLQFTNEGSNLKVTVGDQKIKVLNYSISENTEGGYALSFNVEELAEPSSKNSVILNEYNFESGDSSNYSLSVTEGGESQPTNNPIGDIIRPNS